MGWVGAALLTAAVGGLTAGCTGVGTADPVTVTVTSAVPATGVVPLTSSRSVLSSVPATGTVEVPGPVMTVAPPSPDQPPSPFPPSATTRAPSIREPAGPEARSAPSGSSGSSGSPVLATSPGADPTARTARPIPSPPRPGPGPAVAQPSADPLVPGPDNGPPCRVATQYSDEAPTGLRADVIAGWRTAVSRAARAGVVLCLNDGKRSIAQQEAIFTDYVREYGIENARQYVLPPGKSAHVKGYAVDVQPAAAFQWLQGTRGSIGWCRIYDNEPWHFEYNRRYIQSGCPARLPRPIS